MEKKQSLIYEAEVPYDPTQYENWSEIPIDLENWMGNLPEFLTNVPLIHLAIPGSHNSFTYSLTSKAKVSPDSPEAAHTASQLLRPIANPIICKWSKGQSEDVIKQLKKGIRYFDIRLVVLHDDVLISHGLYGGPIRIFLEKANEFLNSHPKEVLILDFQHFYNFFPTHHERMVTKLMLIFGDKISHRNKKIRENTLKSFWEKKKQIFIVYRRHVTTYNDILWPSGVWPSPWPNVTHIRQLIEILNTNLTKRNSSIGLVSQGILTPDTIYIIFHLFGSLKKMANKVNKHLITWLDTKTSGFNGVNVVICDFIEKFNFCDKVVRLNYKTLTDPKLYIDQVMAAQLVQQQIQQKQQRASEGSRRR